MENLQKFNFENNFIRTATVNDEPWFVGKDIAEALGYSNSSKAVLVHVAEEDKVMRSVPHSQNGNMVSQAAFINESGMYSLILSSKLPSAKKFKRWVTSEVLPAIRKHGIYATPDTVEAMINDPDTMIQTLQALKEERSKRLAAEETSREMIPKAVFADSVAASKDSILIGQMAKILNQNGHDIGQNRFFKYLRENGYLIKTGDSRNMPTQKSMNLKILEITERTISTPYDGIKISKTPKVTGKGQIYFINKFNEIKEKGELL